MDCSSSPAARALRRAQAVAAYARRTGCGTDEAADAFAVPEAAVAEVTSDDRFAGGTLARTGRAELLAWLSEFSL